MVDKQHLLNSKQMAQFVADGLLRFDELVPAELNRAACAEMEAGVLRGKAGVPMDELWQDLAIGQVMRLPAIQGMIDSLVGPGPLYDHHAVHTVNANHEHALSYQMVRSNSRGDRAQCLG